MTWMEMLFVFLEEGEAAATIDTLKAENKMQTDRIQSLVDDVERLRKALEYYGDRQHPYCWDNPKFGDTARAALTTVTGGKGDE